IEVQMVRYKNREDKTGEALAPGSGIKLYSGDRIAFRLKNSGRDTVYPTLLFIDSDFGITSIYPNEGEIVAALPAEQQLLTSAFRVSTTTVGQEQLVAIAVKVKGPPVDFSGLSQPSLQKARGVDSVRGEALIAPLGQLLEKALYREGTRG